MTKDGASKDSASKDGAPKDGPPGEAEPKDGASKYGAAKDGAPQARPTYEKARDELTELVKRLEAGGLTLEQSLELWERGEKLAAVCEDWLEGARARLAAATARRDDADGASNGTGGNGTGSSQETPF